jgi:hypothetical protein
VTLATAPPPQIVAYSCEYCGASKTRTAASHSDGLCRTCGWPMRLEHMFSDRRFVNLPVELERRAA